MKKTQASALSSYRRAFKVSALAAAMTLSMSTPSQAVILDFGDSGWEGSLNTTLTYGLGIRMEDPDASNIGRANGGTAYSVNGDDGNLNFEKGDVFSNAFKVSSELLVERGGYGAFFRVNALYDDVIANDRVASRPLNNRNQGFPRNTSGSLMDGKKPFSSDSVELAGERLELFDAYVFGGFDVGERYVSWKVGNHVLSWGESTFIQNSINQVNPFDVSKLRVPGSELKDAVIPVPMVSGTIDVTQNSTLQAFYQLRSEPFRIDPTGSYFSTNDFAGEGGGDHGVFLSFGDAHDSGNDALPFRVTRDDDREAEDDGQFGLAYRVFAPSLNDTEFGFYFMNYHSRLPVISGRAADAQTVQNASAAADATFNATGSRSAAVGAYINGLVTHAGNNEPAQYYIEYPEDIQLLGVSFNTNLGRTGVALQGELSHRQDVPIQIDDVALLIAAIASSQEEGCNNVNDVGSGIACTAMTDIAKGVQMGAFSAGDTLPGYVLRDVSQFQSTATKAFSRVAGADRLLLIGEVGFNYVHDLPKKDELLFEVNGTYLSGNDMSLNGATQPPGSYLHPDDAKNPANFQSKDDFADDFSWGYIIGGRLEYSNVFNNVNLKPKFSYKHDVKGNSPGPGGSFVEDRKAATLGVDFDYHQEWSGGVSYTSYFGAEHLNLLRDRDFLAMNVQYAF
ncbi:ABC-type dipeptide transport system, periplasmic component [gamma proteobacterium HTCC5015]|nr:ABC-type dipeptide transport system, periplasmic component [gamma proteobacterium HTCC5015]